MYGFFRVFHVRDIFYHTMSVFSISNPKKRVKIFQHAFERIILRRAGAANMVLCTSIQTIDEHETDTHGGGVHTQMSREAWPIQIAIIGAEGQISDALQAFSGTCCAAMDRPCRCAVFSDAESFAASARREEYDVVFCGAGRASSPARWRSGRCARRRRPRHAAAVRLARVRLQRGRLVPFYDGICG